MEAEIAAHKDLVDDRGRQRVVPHGHLSEREVQTGIGPIPVRVPRGRDHTPDAPGGPIQFRSAVLPPYLWRTRSLERLLPWLYRKGVSTGAFEEALRALLGPDAPGLWEALRKVYPRARAQRCWVHKTRNVLDKLPKDVQARAKRSLQQIWMAETQAEAGRAFNHFVAAYEAKYERAVECLAKDREDLLAFYATRPSTGGICARRTRWRACLRPCACGRSRRAGA